jgi:hypothetical protein
MGVTAAEHYSRRRFLTGMAALSAAAITSHFLPATPGPESTTRAEPSPETASGVPLAVLSALRDREMCRCSLDYAVKASDPFFLRLTHARIEESVSDLQALGMVEVIGSDHGCDVCGLTARGRGQLDAELEGWRTVGTLIDTARAAAGRGGRAWT